MWQWFARYWPSSRPLLLGPSGERAAEHYLKSEGWQLLARRWSGQRGEIDLIFRDGDTIVFVEVKARLSDSHGRPEEFVTLRKQQLLTRTALLYLKKNGWLDQRSRFDVVAILWPKGQAKPEIKHYRSAFEARHSSGFYG